MYGAGGWGTGDGLTGDLMRMCKVVGDCGGNSSRIDI